MKSTIKLSPTESLVVSPWCDGAVRLEVLVFGVGALARSLTPDQTGALLFALETAAETARIAQDRKAAA